MSKKEKNDNLRFIGKVKVEDGQYGKFSKIVMDNTYATNKDGVENKYYKGNLFWVDAETGKTYLVKQMMLKGVHESAANHGFTKSICLDLSSQYHVTEQE